MRSEKRKNIVLFVLMYLIFYGTDAASGYIMIWLNQIGFDTLQMGLLTSGATLLALLLQPFVGRLADTSSSRNAVLGAMVLIGAVSLPLLQFSTAFVWIFAVYFLYLTMRNSQHGLCDAIMLDYAEKEHLSYGPFRAMGCIGYAVMAYIAGKIAGIQTEYTFLLYSGICVLTALIVFMLPRSSAARTPGSPKGKANLPMLLKNKQLLVYTAFAVLMACTKSYSYAYYSVYFTSELHGPVDLYGLLLSLAAFTELPIIFFIDRLIQKLGARRMLIFAAILETLRWLMFYLLTNPYLWLVSNTILGANNMTIYCVMVILVNEAVGAENRATGQATYITVERICTMLVGNLLGGMVAKAHGIRTGFLLAVIINIVAITGFILFTKKKEREVSVRI